MKKNNKVKIALTIVLSIGVIAAMALILMNPAKTVQTGGSEDTTSASSEPEKPKNTTISFAAVGDNLIHNNIYEQAAKRADGNGYDFTAAYENFSSYIKGKDIAFINQETLICNDKYAPSSYPSFNSPNALGDHMISMGFNAFSQSNNHVLDKGVDGLNACLDYWDTKVGSSLVNFGAYRNETDYQNIRTMTVKGITFSFVAFTDHTNGLRLPNGAENVIVYTSDTTRMQEQIEKARSISDFVVVSVHWGTENSQVVTDNQKQLATQFADWGADLIIGTHPHVLQPVEFVSNTAGTKQVLTIYSLGNFISTQAQVPNLVGGMLDLELTFDLTTKEYTWSKTKFVPTVTWYGNNAVDVKVYAFSDYTQELAAAHGCRNFDARTSYEYMKSVYESVIDEKYL